MKKGKFSIRVEENFCWIMGALLMFGYHSSAWAVPGECLSTGGTHVYTPSVDYTLTDPSQNTAGRIISNATGWSLGSSFKGDCDCTGVTGKPPVYYRAIVPSGSLFYDDGTNKYYQITDKLAVASAVWIEGYRTAYVSVPFDSTSNLYPDTCSDYKNSTFDTGKKGRISLYFIKPFVGREVIPATTIMNIYGSLISGSFGSTPMTSVILSGTITVPQSCKINDGQVINVDFGDIYNTALKTKGAGPNGYSPKVVQMAYICNNISEGVKLSFTFKGQASSGDSSALATNNNDVGVRIEDTNGTVVSPNSGKLPAQFDYSTQSGSTSFRTYPVNTSGNTPTAGEFSSTATIVANME
ncbi:fimbrial protein [Serratia marcescens]|nr:fimbrial protein [Serratia marcescens]